MLEVAPQRLKPKAPESTHRKFVAVLAGGRVPVAH